MKKSTAFVLVVLAVLAICFTAGCGGGGGGGSSSGGSAIPANAIGVEPETRAGYENPRVSLVWRDGYGNYNAIATSEPYKDGLIVRMPASGVVGRQYLLFQWYDLNSNGKFDQNETKGRATEVLDWNSFWRWYNSADGKYYPAEGRSFQTDWTY